MGTPLGITASGRVHTRPACSAAGGDTAIPPSNRGNIQLPRIRRTVRAEGGSLSAYMWNVHSWAAGSENSRA